MRKPSPRLLAAALAAAAALGLTACDVHVGAYAAVVDGHTISQATLSDAVSSAAADSGYICSVTSAYQAQIRTYGVGKQTYDATFTDFVLATMIRAQLAADSAAAHGLQVTSMLRSVARAQLDGSLGATSGCTETAAQIFGGLSPALQTAYLTLYENLDMLGAKQDGITLTTAGVDSYLASHPSAAELLCLSYIQVSTRTAALQAEAALAKGTNFDTEAAKVSAATSDSVGCATISQLPSQLTGAIEKLAVDQWTAPLSYQSSYLILKLTSTQTATATHVVQQLLTNAEQHFTSLLSTLDRSSSVQIDPAYGSWTRTTGSGPPIDGPVTPPGKDLPAPQSVLAPLVTAPSATTVPGS